MKTPSYVLNNRSWKALAPHVYLVETNGRTRIELHKVKDGRTLRQLQDFKAPCPVCGKMNGVVRFGDHGKGYVAVSCPTQVNYRCMRSRKVSVALQAIAVEIKAEKERIEKERIVAEKRAEKAAKAREARAATKRAKIHVLPTKPQDKAARA
jgi:hypothetical protein